MSVLHIPIVNAHDVSKQIPQEEKVFSAIFYFGILLLKNWLRLRRQFKLNMESCEPADDEELPTFSLGMEFLKGQERCYASLFLFWIREFCIQSKNKVHLHA